jgi:hypothetical protein
MCIRSSQEFYVVLLFMDFEDEKNLKSSRIFCRCQQWTKVNILRLKGEITKKLISLIVADAYLQRKSMKKTSGKLFSFLTFFFHDLFQFSISHSHVELHLCIILK